MDCTAWCVGCNDGPRSFAVRWRKTKVECTNGAFPLPIQSSAQAEAVINQDRSQQLVAEAKKIAGRVDSWISLSNALSDPNKVLIARYFPDAQQREESLRSSAYEELNQLLLRTIKRKGLYPRNRHSSNGDPG
jgi:hypothetical protein